MGPVHDRRRATRAHGTRAAYGGIPRFTYAVGTSNGGYQVRRAVELAPTLFDGGVDWEGTYVDEPAPNILTDLPPGVLNYPDYAHFRLQRQQHRSEEHRKPRATRRT